MLGHENAVLRGQVGPLRYELADLVNEMLVGPVLARMGSGATAGLDPEETSRRITDLVFDGIRAR